MTNIKNILSSINKFKVAKILLTLVIVSLSICDRSQAQDVPRETLPPQPQPQEPETLPPLDQILPELENPTLPGDSGTNINFSNTIFVKKFEVIGSTVFAPEEFKEVLKPYTSKRISFSEILEAQLAIDRLYFEQGYVTSGTFLPPQQLADGVVTIEVVEGAVEEINIEGLGRLDPNYVRSRLDIATDAPLNRDKLLNALQLLQIDPLIENLTAELTAGTKPGTSILELNINEGDHFDVTLSYDNYRAPSVGTDRRRVRLTHRNLAGLGDRFSVGYLNTDGSNSLNNLNYSLPINPRNGTLNVRFNYTDSDIITPPFDSFNLESENTYYELSYRQPLLQKPTEDVAIGFAFSRNDSAITIDGEQQQLSPGADDNGETNISALRFTQEYTKRDADQVIALLSQFSLGIDAFDATVNSGDEPDSKFLAWRAQAQYLQLLGSNFTLLLRSDFQTSDRPLVPTEQFSVGGGLNVRGYRQDALLGDNGWFNSAEVRATVLRIPRWDTSLQLTPFVDFGTVWDTDESEDDFESETNTLLSTGIGLRIQVSDRFTSRLDWGIPLIDLDTEGDSLQENGVYFSLEAKPF